MNKLRRLYIFFRLAYHRYEHTNADQLAGSLSFMTILAMVPLFTVIFIVLAANPELTKLSQLLHQYLVNELLPATGGEEIIKYLFDFSQKAQALGGVGTVFLVITVLLLLNRIESALNQICGVKTHRKYHERLINYWVVITLGPIAVGMVIYLIYQSTYYAYSTLGISGSSIGGFIGKGISILLMTSLLSFIYTALPNKNINIADGLYGAFFTAIAISILQKIFEIYLTNFPTYTLIYGAFATLPIFLLWVYLCWEAFLIGACLVAYFDDKRRGVTLSEFNAANQNQLPPIVLISSTLKIFAYLWNNFNLPAEKKAQLTTRKIANYADISPIYCERILEKFLQTNTLTIVEDEKKRYWSLAVHPQQINPQELITTLFTSEGTYLEERLDQLLIDISQAENLIGLLEKYKLI